MGRVEEARGTVREAPSSRAGAGSGGPGSAPGQRSTARPAAARPAGARASAGDAGGPADEKRRPRRDRPPVPPCDAGTLAAPRDGTRASSRDGAKPQTRETARPAQPRDGTRSQPRDGARPAKPREGRRPTTLRDAMAPAVRRPGTRPGPAEPGRESRPRKAPRPDEARRGVGRVTGPFPLPARPGQRRPVLRPVPDTPGASLARLPLLERPLASYYLLGSSAGLLLLLGLVMVLSASNVRSYAAFGSSYTVFVRQATWMGIGLPVLLAASRAPSQMFRRIAYPLMGVTLLSLLAVLSPLGVASNGAQRWLGVGSFSLQPSELAKLALVLWSADLLTRKRRLLGDWKHLIVPIVPVTAVVGGLIMLQPDMGTTIVVFAVLFVVLWVVGTPGRVYAGLVGALGFVGTILAVIEPYRLERLLSYRDPFQNAQTTGWQAVQGIYALAGGGWFGEGLGASKEKWPNLLPASYTDFILAIIGEELGLLGCLVVVILFGVFGYAGLRVAHRSDNQFVRLAAAGSTGWILTQAVVNMGAVVGLLPITGIPLPLVSFGGSSLVLTMFSIGMLLAFARSEPAAARLLADRSRRRKEARRERRQARRGPDRARPAGRRRGAAPPGAGAETAEGTRPDTERPESGRGPRGTRASPRPRVSRAGDTAGRAKTRGQRPAAPSRASDQATPNQETQGQAGPGPAKSGKGATRPGGRRRADPAGDGVRQAGDRRVDAERGDDGRKVSRSPARRTTARRAPQPRQAPEPGPYRRQPQDGGGASDEPPNAG